MASNYQYALTENEICYLRSCHLTFNIGTVAVRMHFNKLHPPANLKNYLARNKPALKNLKDDDTINKVLWKKLYPASGGPTSDDFDITSLMLLLRVMTTNVKAPASGFFPSKAVSSADDCLACIQYYRNLLAHLDEEKMKTFSSRIFKDLFSTVGKAIEVLCKDKEYSIKVAKAKQLNIDNDIAESLKNIVDHEKQLMDLHKNVNQNVSQLKQQQKELKENRENIEVIQSEQKTTDCSVQGALKQISEMDNTLKLQKKAFEKKLNDQSKQLAEYKTKTKNLEATQAQHGEKIQTLRNQQDDLGEQIEKLIGQRQIFEISSEPKIETKEEAIQIKKPGLFGNSSTIINIPSAQHIVIGNNNTMIINSSSSSRMRTCDISPPSKPAKEDKEIVRQVLDSESTEAANELSGDGSDPGVS